MSATTAQRSTADRPTEGVATAAMRRSRAHEYVTGVLRLDLGLDFPVGFPRQAKDAWLDGGHPTLGCLKFGTKGPFADFYQGIGVALMAGVVMRLAAATGALLLVLKWTAVLPPENNPIIDDHIIDALLLVALALGGAGHALGLGGWWCRLPVVRDHAWLQ